MKNNFRSMAMIALSATVLFSACKKDDPKPEENDNEVITTVELTFTPTAGGSSLVYTWKDADGEGGAAPVIQDIVLAPNTAYNASLRLLDETKSPVENTTDEINEEAVDHRFYYEPSAGSDIIVSNLNNDPNGVPLGLTSTWTTTAAANGSIKITLRHYEAGGKLAADLVSDSKSSTDVEVSFNTKVQ